MLHSLPVILAAVAARRDQAREEPEGRASGISLDLGKLVR
jgi:hypothetical protein